MSLPEEFKAEITAAADEVEIPGSFINEDTPEEGDDSGEEKEETGDTDNGDNETETREGVDDSAKDVNESQESGGEEQDSDGNNEGSEEDGSDAADSVVIPVISDSALTEAVYAGIPIEDARSFASDEALLRVVSTIKNSRADASGGDDKGDKEDLFAGLPDLNEAGFEPEVIKHLEALTNIAKKQQETIDGFRDHQRETQANQEEAKTREIAQWFDEQINNLGEDFTEALGTGNYGDLPQGSSQHAKRTEIATQAAVLLSGYQSTGMKVPPRNEIFNTAARLVLGKEFAEAGEKALAGKLQKRSSQHIQRAGGSKVNKNKNLSPAEEAAQALDEKYF